MHTTNRPRNFDPRTTAQVQDTRSIVNDKPFRTKEQRLEARRFSVRVRGAFVSKAPLSYHNALPKKG